MNDEKGREGNGSEHDSMERYVAGELRAQERARFEEDVLRDEAMSEELYQDVNAHTTIARARSRRRPPLRKKRPPALGALIAVAAAVLYFVWTSRPGIEEGPGSPAPATEEGPRFRSEAAIGGFDIFTPRGVVTESPTAFTWAAEPTAARYRIRIEKSDGTLLHEAEIAAPALLESETSAPVRYPLAATGIEWDATPAVQWNVSALDESGDLIEASPWQPVLVDSP